MKTKYYIDEIGDIWKVNHTNNTYKIIETECEDREYKKSKVEWIDVYKEIYSLTEISEKQANEILVANLFLFDL